MSSDTNDIACVQGTTVSLKDLKSEIAAVEELGNGNHWLGVGSDETLVFVMEINAVLLEDSAMFNDYVLPAVEEKILDITKRHAASVPSVRIYMKPGSVERLLNSGVDPREYQTAISADSDDMVARRPLPTTGMMEENGEGISGVVISLFRKIVGQEPVMDEPFLDLGGDSIKVLEFLEKLQEEHPIPGKDLLDMIEEATTLRDIISWFDT